MVDVLEDLAGSGPVLEFAVGTGRIAAPLAARIPGKPGGDKVEVTIGDMTTTRVAGQFSLAYLVFNTISNVTTQDGQVDVFRNAAAPSYSVTCATLFHSWKTCTGRRPNRLSHTSAHSYLGSVTYSQNNRSAVS
jgi:hypothetical protein